MNIRIILDPDIKKSSHPLYVTWEAMMQRCYNVNNVSYSDYGGRGITVCDAWRNSGTFIKDVEHSIGLRPMGHSIDRIDNDKGYEPGNIRWATTKEQNRNKRPGGKRGPKPRKNQPV